ncbi:hypothetical protein [Methanocaldococcus sp.]
MAFEYRVTIFYPNGDQYISIDKIIINNTNNFEIIYYYRNETIFLPPNSYKVVSLKPKKFNISIYVDVNRKNEYYCNLKYIIHNYYKFPINVSIGSKSITIPGESRGEISFILYNPSYLVRVNNTFISFKVYELAKIREYVPININILKKFSNGKWFVVYNITNPNPHPINISAEFWASVGHNKIYLGQYNGTINKYLNKSFSLVSDKIPIFFIKCKAWVEYYKNITVLPAYKENSRYIIGRAIILGGSYYIPYSGNIIIKEKPKKENKKEGSKKEGKKNNLVNKENKKESSKKEKPKKESKKEEIILKYPLIIAINKNNIKGVLLGTLLPMGIGIIIFVLFFKRPIYSSIHIKNAEFVGQYKFNYSELEIIEYISEYFDITINSAKAIYLAIKYNGIVITNEKNTYELAKSFGIESILVDSMKIKKILMEILKKKRNRIILGSIMLVLGYVLLQMSILMLANVIIVNYPSYILTILSFLLMVLGLYYILYIPINIEE